VGIEIPLGDVLRLAWYWILATLILAVGFGFVYFLIASAVN
jgi:hypothetical protein